MNSLGNGGRHTRHTLASSLTQQIVQVKGTLVVDELLDDTGTRYLNESNVDSTPTTSSTNLVTSGGVKAAIDAIPTYSPTVDSTPSFFSTNLVTSGGVHSAIAELTPVLDAQPTQNSTNLVSSGTVYTLSLIHI